MGTTDAIHSNLNTLLTKLAGKPLALPGEWFSQTTTEVNCTSAEWLVNLNYGISKLSS